MRILIRGLCLLVTLVCTSSLAQAEPFSFLADGRIVFTTALTTQGTFRCRGPVACTGTGTNTITFGSEESHATITFTGVSTALQIGNHTTPVTLGVFETSFTPGFIFPERTSKASPILQFDLFVDQTSPVADPTHKIFTAGPGGTPDLRLFPQAGSSVAFSTSLRSLDQGRFNYTALVYSLRLPVPLSAAGSSSLVADVGATPEPASLLLIGTGLALGWCRRRAMRG